jgi:hypothetical protein
MKREAWVYAGWECGRKDECGGDGGGRKEGRAGGGCSLCTPLVGGVVLGEAATSKQQQVLDRGCGMRKGPSALLVCALID